MVAHHFIVNLFAGFYGNYYISRIIGLQCLGLEDRCLCFDRLAIISHQFKGVDVISLDQCNTSTSLINFNLRYRDRCPACFAEMLVVIKLPYLKSTILSQKLSKGMGHNYYGEAA